ncbi:MAG TPA: hypothetical protein VGR07_11720, partial [Thermoanaerobaculia bacterium]|nr:hypothetical protein [Thermoanaerobaculia bacterium]
MDVSNSTGQDTQYRLGGGGGKAAVNWQPLPNGSRSQCFDPQIPWTIDFQLPDGTVVSATFHHPKAAVALVKAGN